MTTKTSKGDRGNPVPAAGKASKGSRPSGGRKGRKPVAPVKVGKDRNWGPIILFGLVGLIAALIIGFAGWQSWDTRGGGAGWSEQAARIDGIVNYREDQPDMLTRDHVDGPVQYSVLPPVGGNHGGTWQNCQGTVYTEPIANENAVHSLEHGAVWVTYNPDLLPADQVESLAGLVEGNDKMFMSPVPELDRPISLQAWGYQLKVDSAGDGRINQFVRALRTNASIEGPTARCDGGTTTTGTTPLTPGGQTGG
jgi:hypothetical protein